MSKLKAAEKTLLAIAPFIWTSGEDRGVRTVFEPLQGYRRAGYDVHVITLDHRGSSQVPYRGLTLHTFSIPFASWIGNYSPYNSLFAQTISKHWLVRYLVDKLLWLAFIVLASVRGLLLGKRYRPTLIYGFTSYGSPVASLLGWILGVPNITRLLGTFLYPYVELAKATDFRTRLRGYVQLAAKFTEVLAFRWPAKAVIVTNDGTLGDEVARFLGARSPVFCWVNGFAYQDILPDRVKQVRSRLVKDDEVLVVWAGQFIPWKRMDRWLQVAAYVSGRRTNVQFVIVGDGHLRPELQQLATNLRLDSRVEFVGAVGYSDVWHYFSAADIFMSCHDLTNACNTLFEAMICGLPIVTVANGSTPQFLSSEQAVLISPLDSGSLVNRLGDALIELVDNHALREELSEAGRAYARENLVSWEQRMQYEIEVIESLTLMGTQHITGLGVTDV